MAVTASEQQAVTYLDLDADIGPWLSFSGAVATPDSAPLLLISGMAQTWVAQFLGRPVAPTTFTRRFDGGAGLNSNYISLPFTPVLSVTSVVESRGTASAIYVESTPQAPCDGYQIEPSTGRLIRVNGQWAWPWFPGSRNVQVTWVAGYEPVPDDIKVATLELIAHWFRNTRQRSPGGGRPTGADYDPLAAGLWAGVPNRITGLLTPYMKLGVG